MTDPDALDRAREGLRLHRRERLGELAVARGWITREQLSGLAGQDLTRELVSRRLISAGQLAELLRDAGREDGAGPAPAEPGATVDGYVLDREIGRGGMGAVWKAWDPRLKRWIALKLLREGASDHARERFLREAHASANLKHPHLVTVHGAGQHDGRPYIAMELIEGSPLDLRRPRREVLEILRKAALAVEEAHRRGVVHRDLKPGNILVDGAGEPHVVDFGLAHLDDERQALTLEGSMVGTPQYMAPEQVDHHAGSISARADVFALGAMLYESLTGRPPHLGATIAQTLRKILGEDPEPPRRRDATLPADLETVCLKALEKAPSRRYASAGEFAAELGRFLQGEPVLAKPRSRWSLGVRWARRRWAALTAVLLVLLAVAAAGMWVRRTQRGVEDYQAAYHQGLEAWERATRIARARPPDRPALDRAVSEATGRFSAAARSAPDRPEALLMMGRCLLLAGRPDEAESAWTRALERRPGFAAAHLERGLHRLASYVRLRSAPAARLGSSDFAVGPPRPETEEEAARRRAGLEDLRQAGESAELARFREGLVAWGEGRYDEAVSALQAYLAAEGWDARARALRGCALYMKGRFREAVDELTHALDLDRRGSWLMARGHARLAAGRAAEALADYHEYRKLGGDDAEAAAGLALKALGRLEEAEAELSAALKRQPGDPVALNNRGTVRAERRDLKGAEEDFRLAIHHHPAYVEALNNLGNALVLQGRPREALAEYDLALEIDPSFGPGHLNRAIARTAAGEDALGDLRKAAELMPANPEALFLLAQDLAARGEKDEARRRLEEALRCAPSDWPRRLQAERLMRER